MTVPESDLLEYRREIIRGLGADESTVDELIAYNENVFSTASRDFPERDQAHVEVWRDYERDAAREGTIPVLSRHLVQLSFPVEEGISKSDRYRAATLKGEWPEEAFPPPFENPDAISLAIHPTGAGSVPVIIAGSRGDFETLVRVFSARNEPIPVPDSMGASIVRGFNNWDRIRRLREEWEANGGEDWSAHFRSIIPRKELYQDCFIILSSGYYSNVPPEETAYDPEQWRDLSIEIRRAHEATHYFTWRVLGAMRNNLLDEIMADYAGLVEATGSYDDQLALRFLGLENHPEYRAGGRLENYPGDPPLSPGATEYLRELVVRAIRNLRSFDEGLPPSRTEQGRSRAILALARLGLEELADSSAVEKLWYGMEGGSPVSSSEVLRIRNDSSEMERVLTSFDRFAETNKVPEKTKATFIMALDELVSNSIKYGYDDQAEHEIEVGFLVEDGVLQAHVLDDGHEFDPFSRDEPDTSLGIDERDIGGLGLLLVKELTDEHYYRRENDMNRVVIRKRL